MLLPECCQAEHVLLTAACVPVQLAGVVIAPVAVLFMCYALFQYRRRTRQVRVVAVSFSMTSCAPCGPLQPYAR